MAGEDSDHGSIAPPARTPFQRKNRFCAICSTTETPKWYRCPNNISELDVKPTPLVMCESCGIRWRHCKSLINVLASVEAGPTLTGLSPRRRRAVPAVRRRDQTAAGSQEEGKGSERGRQERGMSSNLLASHRNHG